MSNQLYYAAMNEKLINKSNQSNLKNSIRNKNKLLTNNIINYYNNDFNSKYDTNRYLDKEIMTKTQLIDTNEFAFNKKNNIVLLLSYLLYLLIFFFFIFLFSFYFNLFSKSNAAYIIIISTIAYIIYVVYKISYDQSTGGNDNFKDFAKTFLPHYITDARCPKGCKSKSPHHWFPNGESDVFREMSTDSTLNFWKKGDIPISQANDKNSQPQPWYGPDNNATQYTCEWDGTDSAKSIGGMPYKFTSTVPCKYFPGYKKI